ncbi:2620_t:CDS:2, partial [Acaulospora colombiana]
RSSKNAMAIRKQSAKRAFDNEEYEDDDDYDDECTETEVESEEEFSPTRKRKRKVNQRVRTPIRPSKHAEVTTPSTVRVKSISRITPLALRLQPTDEPQSCYDRARSMLRLEEVPEFLPCREKEYKLIHDKIKSAIEQFSGHRICKQLTFRIVISGQPGTGKTATVRQVVRNLQKKVEKKELVSFKFIEINGMELRPPEKAYTAVWERLTGDLVSIKDAESLLSKIFSTPSKRSPIILMIDEFDSLVNKQNKVIYNFLNWTTLLNSHLIVVALTNRIDLPVTMLSVSSDSRMGLDRFTFAPYTHAELTTIIRSRLEGINLFTNEAVEFAARK